MTTPSPYDDPVPRGWKLVQGTLRVTVALQCAGMAAAHLHGQVDSPVFDLLQTYYEIPESALPQAQDIAAYAFAAAAVLTLLRPCWAVLLPVILWIAASAAALAVDEDNVIAAIEHTVRVAAPVVLLLVDFWPPRLDFSIGRAKIAMGLLQIAIIVSLGAHSLMLLRECGSLGEYASAIERASSVLPGGPATSAQLAQGLAVAFAMDVLLAAGLLLSRSRPILLIAVCWGVVLAALPLAASGPAVYYESLIRAAGTGAPLALLCYWLFAVKDQPSIIVPGRS
ncbi:MAG: hypothetical protein DWQ34_04315 [Planctomycetota bacterium]|nr:MAG: hypothetical protein DWQ29_19815 [Planctomycetota bacterium]REJ96268.1 MAG: hypothetical protein DWQ34_04315 [Planctomycetota bacterium]REK22266.1 MAG: hypothetical protein DWQ41_19570 [Planctomycetota bacterium]REK27448.1 MAG: hypothetical protein DWQ45_25490 [Planctomycetota bacterium]